MTLANNHMKTIREIESWSLKVLERVAKHQFEEDSLVELKRSISDDYKIARRIAGHCNAARGETVLWIIGADEIEGITGHEGFDLAEALPRIWHYFDGERPEFSAVSLEFSGQRCTALAFSADRVPYVIKNPRYGSEAGHVIEREIPWRDGTRVRTAKRDEVIRLLLDYTLSPQVEFFSGEVFSFSEKHSDEKLTADSVMLRIHIVFYVMPRCDQPLIIPYHRIRGYFCDVGHEAKTEQFDRFKFYSRESYRKSINRMLTRRKVNQVTVHTDQNESVKDTGSDLNIYRAACVEGYIDAIFSKDAWNAYDMFQLELVLPAGPDEIPITIQAQQLQKKKG